jgi:hypothetical protein
LHKTAQDKTAQARQGVENLKIRAKETKDKDDVQATKEEAKSTVKTVIGIASEKVQDRLDDAKTQIEQQKREKELDRAIGNPSAAEILNKSPGQFQSPVLTPTPALVTPATSTAPIPFDSTSPTSLRPSSPTILNNSADGYSAPPFNAAAHHLPSESSQFSPNFAGPSFSQPPLSSRVSSSAMGSIFTILIFLFFSYVYFFSDTKKQIKIPTMNQRGSALLQQSSRKSPPANNPACKLQAA